MVKDDFFYFTAPPTGNCRSNCPLHLDWVCGSNGRTYPNECIMKHDACKKGIEIIVASKGKCAKGTSSNHFYQLNNRVIKVN